MPAVFVHGDPETSEVWDGLRGDLLRSWASDSLEAFDKRYEAHRWAQVWQTPTAGEAWVENNLATPSRERRPSSSGWACLATSRRG